MSAAEGERPRERERDGLSSAPGGLQRPRADGPNSRVNGRPLVQRTRNASFAMPKMRSPSFMLKEKEDEIPDANASPWGVEEDRKPDAEKTDTKGLADKHIQARVTRKMSGIGLPTSPSQSGLSFSSPKAKERDRERHSTEDDKKHSSLGNGMSPVKKGIRKSMSRFGGGEEMQGIGDFAATHSPGSTISSTSSVRESTAGDSKKLSADHLGDGSNSSAVTKSKSKILVEELDTVSSTPGENVNQTSSKSTGERDRRGDEGSKSRKSGFVGSRTGSAHRSASRTGSSKANDDKGQHGAGQKKRGVQINRKEKDYDGPSGSKGKEGLGRGKSKKFGFSLSKLRGHSGKHHDTADVELEEAHEEVLDESGQSDDDSDAGAGSRGGEMEKTPSIQQDDFVNYQTRPKVKSRKSRALFHHND